MIEGISVHHARVMAGMILAKYSPVEADIVVGVPDSGLDAALGYAEQSGIPYGIGFIKNKYIGRSFIQPSQNQRESAVKIKLNAVRESVRGKRVIMIDDSEENLIANHCETTEDIAKYIGADSLAYLSTEALSELIGGKQEFCRGCFTGDYPLDVSGAVSKNKFDEKIHKVTEE